VQRKLSTIYSRNQTVKKNVIGRYLLDYDNPDAGIGHSLGHVNNAVKVCMRNQLEFAYSDKQLIKSSKGDFKWRMRQWLRTIVGRKAHETHGIGDAICRMFAFSKCTVSRGTVEALIKQKLVKVVELPGPDIVIPSNSQDDDQAYAGIEAVIKAHPQDGIAFVLPAKRTGDFEYGTTRDWFKRCYQSAHVKGSPVGGAQKAGSKISVAVHVRRGDLLPGRQFADLSHRMLPDSWYVHVLKSIARVTGCYLHIVVLSEGLNGTYSSELGREFSWEHALQHLDCDLVQKIDHDFMDSFHDMVEADVMIGSKSGMTHLAGLMSDHIKVVPKMWHSYRGTEHVIELNDTFTDAELEACLELLWTVRQASART
jgi:hypothetical protein